MRNYRSEAIAAEQAQAEPGLGIGVLVRAALTGSLFMALAGMGVSFLVWHSIWWELSLGLALLPIVGVAAGMVGIVFREAASVFGRDAGNEGEDTGPERVRLIPLRSSTLIDGVDAEDLRFFVRGAIGGEDWTQARWRGAKLPSGRKCDNAYHQALMACLVKAGIVEGYARGVSGYLAVPDVDRALRLLGVDG